MTQEAGKEEKLKIKERNGEREERKEGRLDERKEEKCEERKKTN